jgi:hypothetical protein
MKILGAHLGKASPRNDAVPLSVFFLLAVLIGPLLTGGNPERTYLDARWGIFKFWISPESSHKNNFVHFFLRLILQ